jgi:hypothetical protein
VRDTSSSSIVETVVALDQRHLVRSLSILEVPPVARVGLDTVRLTDTVRVYESGRDKVRVWNGVGVCHGQGVLVDCFDRPPDLDYVR